LKEPGTNYYCDIDYDVFEFMELNNYKYGFTMSLHEYIETIPTLWDETKVCYVLKSRLISEIHQTESKVFVKWKCSGFHLVQTTKFMS
jgi:Glycolipid 2-alpha-mannosyltransferase